MVIQGFIGFQEQLVLLQDKQDQDIPWVPDIEFPVAGELQHFLGLIDGETQPEGQGDQLVP